MMAQSDPNEPHSGFSTRATLLLRLRDGQDGECWREFHQIYGRLIFGYALQFGIRPAEAEDVVQDVCVKVFRRIGSLDYSPERGRFRGWLKTITRNTVIDYLRRRQRRMNASREYAREAELTAGDRAGEDDDIWRREWEKALCKAALERVRARVSDETYCVFCRYVLERCPPAEAADGLGLDANAVYLVKNRMLSYIREEVGKILSNEAQ